MRSRRDVWRDYMGRFGLALVGEIDPDESGIKGMQKFFSDQIPDSSDEYVNYFIGKFASVRATIGENYRDVVLLLDSLDRMSSLSRFSEIVDVGVMKLRSLGIGVILAGPLTSLYGLARTSLDRFDRTWHAHGRTNPGPRSHMHPGHDDLIVPAPLLSPLELVDLFVSDRLRLPDRPRKA